MYYRYSAAGLLDDVGECKVPQNAMLGKSGGMAGNSISALVGHPDASSDEFVVDDIQIHDGSESPGEDAPIVGAVLEDIRRFDTAEFTETTERYSFVTAGARAIATSTDPLPIETYVAYPHPRGVVSGRVPGVSSSCPVRAERIYRRFVQSHRQL